MQEKALKHIKHIIHLAQERDQWQAVVNMAMNLQVPCKAENFLTE
jgi:hypothetical protein